MLVRSWNVFHGNAHPPERRAFLAEMVRLASADRPDLLCLQELPVWSLRRLQAWSGMVPLAAVATRPLLPAALAKAITDLHHGLFRSAFTGQANAILLGEGLRAVEHRVAAISRPERRVCQAARLETGLVIANLHASGNRLGIGEVELERALASVESFGSEAVVLAGDFNFRPQIPGFTAPGPGIDHVLVRGVAASPLTVWPRERRVVAGRVLSDHAPVELRVGG